MHNSVWFNSASVAHVQMHTDHGALNTIEQWSNQHLFYKVSMTCDLLKHYGICINNCTDEH